ncbi:MAG: hypothetical protein ACXW2E_02005 [Nitrososphaeraceae archaeon]
MNNNSPYLTILTPHMLINANKNIIEGKVNNTITYVQEYITKETQNKHFVMFTNESVRDTKNRQTLFNLTNDHIHEINNICDKLNISCVVIVESCPTYHWEEAREFTQKRRNRLSTYDENGNFVSVYHVPVKVLYVGITKQDHKFVIELHSTADTWHKKIELMDELIVFEKEMLR